MDRLTEKIAKYCVKENYIKAENIPWFKYNLEKKISTFLIGVPFLIIALIISNFLCAISFFASFFFVRKYIGGYHAKTVCGCLVFSLLLEIAFVGVLPYFLTTHMLWGLLGTSMLLILSLAPHNHRNLHFTSEEIKICRKKGRLRLYVVLFINVITYFFGIREVFNGCTIGIAMSATLLCLGYIHDWRIVCYEKQAS